MTTTVSQPSSDDAEEQRRRRLSVDNIRHSTVMEGGVVPDAIQTLQERWVCGEITSGELKQLTRQHVIGHLDGEARARAEH